MVLFRTRSTGSSSSSAAGGEPLAQAESVESLRRRARHRLIGAVILVAVAVFGFPILFDSQPRPVSVDVPIVIPDRAKARPMTMPGAQAPASAGVEAAQPAAAAPVTPPPAPSKVPATASLDPKEEVVAPAPTRPASAAPAARAATASVPRSSPASAVAARAPAASSRADDGARARALLEGRPAESASAAADVGRFVVQVGAYSEDGKVREARAKLEKAGLKTYAQVVDAKEGKRTRVRVGPYGTRAEAEKAAAKIKGLDLPAVVLAL